MFDATHAIRKDRLGTYHPMRIGTDPEKYTFMMFRLQRTGKARHLYRYAKAGQNFYNVYKNGFIDGLSLNLAAYKSLVFNYGLYANRFIEKNRDLFMEDRLVNDLDILLVSHMHGNETYIIHYDDKCQLNFLLYKPDPNAKQRTFLINDRNKWYGISSEAYYCMVEHFYPNNPRYLRLIIDTDNEQGWPNPNLRKLWDPTIMDRIQGNSLPSIKLTTTTVMSVERVPNVFEAI